MDIKRILPLFLFVITLVFLEVFIYNPEMIYVSLVIICSGIFFCIWRLCKNSKKAKDWYYFLFLPITFLISAVAFSTLSGNRFLTHFIIILTSIFIYIYIRTVFNYLYKRFQYKNLSLENISSYGNFLAFFFMSATVFGLQSFLNITIWYTIIIIMVGSLLILMQMMWVNNVKSSERFVYLVLGAFVLVELAWSISYLPSNFLVSGFVLSVCYYMLIGLTRFHLLKELNKRIIKLYLGFGLSSILIVLLTARWL